MRESRRGLRGRRTPRVRRDQVLRPFARTGPEAVPGSGPVRMAGWACAFVAALFAHHAGADPVITPDPGRNAAAISPLAPGAVSDKRHGLKLDYSIAPVGLRIVLPPPDSSKERAAAARGGKRRTVVGFHRDMPDEFEGDLSPQLDWTRHADGSFVSSLTVTSPGAKSVRAGIRAELIAGGEIRFFGFESDEGFAPITREDFHLEGGEIQTLWSPTVEGDTIGIEIALPSEKARSAFSFHVDEIAHDFRSIEPSRLAPKQLECPDLHIDVQCRAGSTQDDLEDAVALIRFELGDLSLGCSGTLLNDKVPATFVPYFLTARHCVPTGSVARSVEAWWFYQRATCGGSAEDRRFSRTSGGADLLTASSRYDLALLRLREAPPGGLKFSGWSALPIAHPADAYGIHHPAGELKKFSAGTTADNLDSGPVTNAIPVTWSEGGTEGGSSGSGLFLRNGGYLVGALSHGPDCGPHVTDYYGPFGDFLPQASRWLDSALPLPADDDHGDSPAAASVVPAHSSTGGILERNGDSDWFRIDLAAEDALRVRTTGPTDTYGRLSVAGGDFSREDDDSGTGSNFEILVLEAPAGTWHIEVSGADTGTTGPYTLHVDAQSPTEHLLPLVPAASNLRQQGSVRIVNRSHRNGSVEIHAIDDSGRRFGPVSLLLGAGVPTSFSSRDLERGNPSRGLSGGVGEGSGDWRLELRTYLDIEARAYVRGDGFLSSVHDVVEEESASGTMIYRVPLFNPASNLSFASSLRLINLSSEPAGIVITGFDARGMPPPGEALALNLPAGAARTLSAQQIEQGDGDLLGSLGDGEGKWQLYVVADQPLQVMSLMQSRSGYLGNLSR